ncbi:metallophosphoesterase [Fimbriiglobus ruber]|uniref:Calcineurin-like phosphoesterase domain-containing protein n=1 Tax=Fimbriiglobus ruber TaxID=1908690 RepID=A0A225DZG5_9BACT|nr:metallophosphoesterase [Fimbriiglobus ruber]OWK46741.1 hypothetical protein FRUB_00440 [Fimbriiglobus ruber]
MRRILLLVTAVVCVAAAAVYSRQQSATGDVATTQTTLTIKTEEKNPWTHLNLNNGPEQFQFAVVTDRTGGHRAKVFSRAVQQINLLQPEFVMSVGDLIEGYTSKEERIKDEWKEFEGYIKKFEMPFFYVPGNHDLSSKELVTDWGGRYGRKYYHFIFKNVLFLAVNSEDPTTKISEEQAAYFKKVLDENPAVRWTMVFLHKPLWADKDIEKNGWGTIERALAGRKYTAFCGHVHRYQKFVRNGMNYYQLATTGGGSKMRGVAYGEFDHIAWITMKKDGPLIANVLLDGVLPEDLKLPESEEPGSVRKMVKTYPLKGKVSLDGKPVGKATVRFYKTGAMDKFTLVADGVTETDGTFLLSTYKAFDGVPVGEYTVTVKQVGEYDDGDTPGAAKNTLPGKYAAPKTSPLKVEVKAEGANEVNLELTK